jgi:hypothetical protein
MEIYLMHAPSNQSSNTQRCQKTRMINTSWVPFKHLNHQKTNKRASNVIWTLIRFGTHHVDSTWLVNQETWPCLKNLKHFHATCVDLFPTSPKVFNLKHVWSFKLYFEPWSFLGRCAKWEYVFGVPKFLSLNLKHFYLFR